jgi:hypothetical protein
MEDSQIINTRKIYQAIGTISGILELTDSQYSSLTVGDQTYCVIVSRKVKEKHQPLHPNPEVNPLDDKWGKLRLLALGFQW